ncbi:MAG: glycoside hydrolase family 31 protein, partial [Proteiniphilum sp.]|nr:glycoside hydrolase family 31 protein [Proteiniphilum sp.]
MKRILSIALGIFLFVSCTSTGIEKTEHGIIVRLQPENSRGVRNIRLQVVNEKIIHVSATSEKSFSTEKSLITKPGLTFSDRFTVEEKEDRVILSTDSLDAVILLETGEIAFLNKKGEPILQEQKGGGKTLTPIEVEGTKGFTIHQLFESPDDEAFYGLGQHQADDFNYKGKNESLFQYNTKVSVPFVISNNNYGIVWDNYSLSKFGDVRDYADLDQFRLYGSDGSEGGLTAVYAKKKDPSDMIVRKETKLDYQFMSLLHNFPENFDLNDSRVVWSGEIEAPESGLYRFFLHYAGYTKVYLNNQPVVEERWRTAWNPNSYKFDYPLQKGERVPLRIEWEPDGDVSYIALKALSPVSDELQNKLSLWSEMGNGIDYYFVAGCSMDEVISGYRTLTGKSQIMPKWAMGFWQSRERYKTQDEIVGTLAEFRKREIPIDNIVQDWSYWPEQEWGSHQFDAERFPDPQGMVDRIHEMNARIMISVWPKFY